MSISDLSVSGSSAPLIGRHVGNLSRTRSGVAEVDYRHELEYEEVQEEALQTPLSRSLDAHEQSVAGREERV